MDWDLNDDGTIKLCPLMSFETATMPLGGIVRLQYAESLEDIDYGKRRFVQIQMNENHARELGEALLRMANTISAETEGSS